MRSGFDLMLVWRSVLFTLAPSCKMLRRCTKGVSSPSSRYPVVRVVKIRYFTCTKHRNNFVLSQYTVSSSKYSAPREKEPQTVVFRPKANRSNILNPASSAYDVLYIHPIHHKPRIPHNSWFTALLCHISREKYHISVDQDARSPQVP